jgi:hypothetical protein
VEEVEALIKFGANVNATESNVRVKHTNIVAYTISIDYSCVFGRKSHIYIFRSNPKLFIYLSFEVLSAH